MKNPTSISDLPNVPAIYAMYGGQSSRQYVAYVGLGKNLKGRAEQHLVRRDSSVTTGVSAVGLNPDNVSGISWWEHPEFEKREVLEAAELVAFDVLEPALRSRGGITDRAKQLYADQEFRERMTALFNGDPVGRLVIRTLPLAWKKIEELEERLARLEANYSE